MKNESKLKHKKRQKCKHWIQKKPTETTIYLKYRWNNDKLENHELNFKQINPEPFLTKSWKKYNFSRQQQSTINPKKFIPFPVLILKHIKVMFKTLIKFINLFFYV